MGFLLWLVVTILDIIAIIHILRSKEEGLKKAIWIVIVFILPVLGMILWYVLGEKKA